jgi:hypothetical protein
MSVVAVPDNTPGAGSPVARLTPRLEPPRVRPAPKLSPERAWAAWQASGAASSGTEFLRSVSSWMEGTANQLLRQGWGPGVKRPSSAEVQERLHHNLGVAARGGHPSYVEALAWARVGVIEELHRVQLRDLPA